MPPQKGVTVKEVDILQNYSSDFVAAVKATVGRASHRQPDGGECSTE